MEKRKESDRRLAVGIVGCGAVGRAVLKGAMTDGATRPSFHIVAVTSRDEAKARAFLAMLPAAPDYLPLEELIDRADLVVEASGGGTVPELARRVFDASKDLLVISIGALLEHPHLLDEARARGCRLLLPSGAIAGLDGIKAACEGEVERVTITTRKPPAGLAGAPYLVEQGISLEGLKQEREVFHGSAREACLGFPANVNVSAAVSLAGIGADRTMIRILAVPGLERNVHQVEVEGEFGRMTVEIQNNPSVENPRSGRLTAMSILRALRDAADPVRIGT